MIKPRSTVCGVLCATFISSLLTGCDLLGLGPKKSQGNTQNQSSSTNATTAAAPAVQAAPQGPLPSDVLVRIGTWALTKDEFNQRLNLLKQQIPDFKEDDAQTKNAVLEELIRQQLLVKEAEDSNIGDTKEVKDAVEDFRKTLLVQEIASRLTKDIAVTEEDARSYYEVNKEKFVEPVKWKVRDIVVDDETAAKNILVQVLQGGDFAQIAQTQSKAANAATGGVLKPFATGKEPFLAMQAAIANLDAGGVSAVFKGPEGYYIVKVDSKTGGSARSFSDVKKDLIYGLTMQKQQQAILEHLNVLAQKNKVEINKEAVDDVVGRLSTNEASGDNGAVKQTSASGVTGG